ncbi:Amino acid ABC transporter, ATP-binding protein [Nitrospina gracilis 3/211]|uniref:Amino acid ABC transporter, ATP-binding protein n=1 Tax=Nitrospina gracilis (strain 3/211) TaxID=1266370 RepID=M1Z8W8_NITG3|nr:MULTISPECIES: amino acid ABC transporter ATP-binding protein [Nitrospina]MCF8722609.1 polar amino acid transport system ATP-binding protein [Nitrospina sp. Nb-3]CCQ89538.1 Amino acid ABC transporter, ATP-binding protein [Nitrospina gracilis 3/211]
MIHVEGLTKCIGDHTILRGIDLDVPTGGVHVVIGPSGAGKSCLLRCIAALEPFEEGRVRVDDLEIAGTETDGHRAPDPKRVRALRIRVGMVFQQFNLFPHMTVLQNLIEAPVQVLGLPRAAAEEKARALLGKVHLHNLSHRYPGDLSGGEQQRVAIARTLAMNPNCVLIDEPTSALDPEMVGEVLRVLRELADEGMTMLIVTHEMDFARSVADRVVMLDRGEVVEAGEPAQFFSAPATDRARIFLKRLLER